MPKFVVSTLPLPMLYGDNDPDSEPGINGNIISASSVCYRCTECQCIDKGYTLHYPDEVEIHICYRGVGFYRFLPGIVMCGFFVSEWKPPRSVKKSTRSLFHRNMQKEPESTLPYDLLVSTIRRFKESVRRLAEDKREEVELEHHDKKLEQFVNFHDWADGILSRHFEAFHEMMGHDVLQLLSLITQNMESCLTRRYGKFERALRDEYPRPVKPKRGEPEANWQQEKAVYLTAQLAILRLEMIQFMAGGDQFRFEDPVQIPVHRAFQKVIRPYIAFAANRGVLVHQVGSSYGCTSAPVGPFHIPILAVMDNAVKYSPRGDHVYVTFKESASTISVSIESNGPKIKKEELEHVFEKNFRGLEAKRLSRADGHGIGLWISSLLMDDWGASISVAQESDPVSQEKRKVYPTIFTLEYPRVR